MIPRYLRCVGVSILQQHAHPRHLVEHARVLRGWLVKGRLVGCDMPDLIMLWLMCLLMDVGPCRLHIRRTWDKRSGAGGGGGGGGDLICPGDRLDHHGQVGASPGRVASTCSHGRKPLSP